MMIRVLSCLTLLLIVATNSQRLPAQDPRGPVKKQAATFPVDSGPGSPLADPQGFSPRPGGRGATVPDTDEQAPLTEPVFKVLHLQNAVAADLVDILGQLFRDSGISIVSDSRTNSLLMKGPEKIFPAVEALALKLDEESSRPNQRAPAVRPPTSQRPNAAVSEKLNVTELKEQYENQEQIAAEIARQVGKHPAADAGLKQKLRSAVATAFALRQQLHQTELAAFQQRMERVRHTIQTREEIKEQIIDRRVADLLNPTLNWEETAAPTVQPAAQPTIPTTVPNAVPPTADSWPTRKPTHEVSELDGDWLLESMNGAPPLDDTQRSPVRAVAKIRSYANSITMLSTWNGIESTDRLVLNSKSDPKAIELIRDVPDSRSRISGLYRLEGDKLTIAWGQNHVRPTGFEPADSALIATWRRIEKGDASIRVELKAPAGGLLTELDQYRFNATGMGANAHALPVTVQLSLLDRHQIQLSRFTTHPQLELFATLEFPSPAGWYREYQSLATLPIQVTDDDCDQVGVGNMVVKVVYHPRPQVGGFGPPRNPSAVQVLVSTRLDPGVDVVQEARRLGTVWAVVRMSNKASAASNVDTEWQTPKQPSRFVPLKAAVHEFNTRNAGHPVGKNQIALTEDEVVAAIRWALMEGKFPQFSRSETDVLRQIAQDSVLPDGWTLSVTVPALDYAAESTATQRPQRFPSAPSKKGPSPEVQSTVPTRFDTYSIHLSHRPSEPQPVKAAPELLIRKQFLGHLKSDGSIIDESPMGPPPADPNVKPLGEAIQDFNALNNKIEGETQPPITINEVVAALREVLARADQMEITTLEQATLKTVVESKVVPSTVEFELLPTFVPGDGFQYEIWSVRLRLPRLKKSDVTNAFVIRERFIRSTRIAHLGDVFAPGRMDSLRTFDSAEGPSQTVNAGVVKTVREDGILEISLAEPGTGRVGDVWVVQRPHDGGGERFARVALIEVRKETALGRVTEAARERVGNEYVFKAVQVGDEVGRPPHAPVPLPGQPRADATTILRKTKEFQKRFFLHEQIVKARRKQTDEARAALASGTGNQAAIDDSQRALDESLKELRLVHSEFNSQVNELELNLRVAQKALTIADHEYQKSLESNRVLPGTIALPEIQRLEIAREGAKLDIEHAITLLEICHKVTPATDATEREDQAILWQQVGLKLATVEPDNAAALPKFFSGLRVLEVRTESPASRASIVAGDILIGLGEWETRNLNDAIFALQSSPHPSAEGEKGTIAFYVVRNGSVIVGQIARPALVEDPLLKRYAWRLPHRQMTYTFNSKSEYWRGFLLWLARTTDRGLQMEGDPQGRFEYATMQPLRLDEILEIVNTELAPQGLQVNITDKEILVSKKDQASAPGR